MLKAHRLHVIKEILMREQSVKVADLVDRFKVSEETIRRDLNELEVEGIVKKNYGGAILVQDLISEMANMPPVQQRRFQHYEEKDAIGALAASLVKDDQVVVVDSGSTTWCVARHLKDKKNLTVVTNGIYVAEEVSQNPDCAVFVIGGKLNSNSMSVISPQPDVEILKYNADTVILGATGVSARKGFTSSDLYEAEVKRAMVKVGHQVVIVTDHTKLQKQGLISFGSFEEVDILVTSSLADEEVLREIEQQGVKILVCEVAVSMGQS